MFFDSVIFDLDNTLYDYDYTHSKSIEIVIDEITKFSGINKDICFRVYNESNKSLKSELNNTAASHSKFISIKLTIEKLNLNMDVLELDKLYWDNFFNIIKLNYGVIQFLEYLSSKNINMYILTDYTIKEQFLKLEHLSIRKYFKDIISSEEVGIEKPSKKSFLYTLNKIKSDKVIMIGDNIEKDINGAYACGIYPFWFNKSKNFTIEIDKTTFNDFNDLLSKIKSLDNGILELKKLSKLFGERFDLIQAGGGNISVKVDELMFIKSSGLNLSDLREDYGYSIIENTKLKKDVLNDIYENINNYNLFINNRASMETYMHSFLKKYTIHLHPIQCNNILVRKNYKEILESLIPNSCIIEYVTPGIDLSKEISKHYNNESIILMANHGIIVTSDVYEDILTILNNLLVKCENYIDVKFDKYKIVNNISKILNNLTGNDYISMLSDDNVITSNIKEINFESSFPDKVIFCGHELLKTNLSELKENIIKFISINNDSPKIIIIETNIYIISTSINKCRDIESILKSMILINKNSETYLSNDECEKLNNLDSEKFRKEIKK